MSTLSVIDAAGKSLREVELNEAWLERERGEQAVHETVVAYQAAQRAGTASTKTRGEVRGGGAKPWRQKGTGRARAGSSRSPIWVGGGTSFGPRPRKYFKRINKKVRQLALRRVFTDKVDTEGGIKLLETLPIDQPKTRDMVTLLKGIGATGKTLVLLDDADYGNLKLAARNLQNVVVTTASTANVYEIIASEHLVLTEAALEILGSRLLSTSIAVAAGASDDDQ